jgi:hypothetical protein
MEKAKDIFGNEIKGAVINNSLDTELLQNAFDYLSEHYEYTTTYHVFVKGSTRPVSLTTKKFAADTLGNYEKGEAVLAYERKSFAKPKKVAAYFGVWAIVSN